jgi:type II secretory pathway pseudopilin PulG
MRCRASSRRRESQRGFALLLVFLMAAIVALMLYQQLPRVAFESEREKEQLLIDRGEQYTRAIQLYYLANNRQYPTSIDDLEKREKRFLRRRYVDPYTGKDEWRIIHTNGGLLTDSLVQKPLGSSDSQSASANTTATDGQPQVNTAVLQRPSDRPVTPLPGFRTDLPEQDPATQQQPGNNALPPITLQPQQGPGRAASHHTSGRRKSAGRTSADYSRATRWGWRAADSRTNSRTVSPWRRSSGSGTATGVTFPGTGHSRRIAGFNPHGSAAGIPD